MDELALAEVQMEIAVLEQEAMAYPAPGPRTLLTRLAELRKEEGRLLLLWRSKFSNNRYHYIGSREFCSGCGKTEKCCSIVEGAGRIDCWCEPCWDDFIGLAYKERGRLRKEKQT